MSSCTSSPTSTRATQSWGTPPTHSAAATIAPTREARLELQPPTYIYAHMRVRTQHTGKSAATLRRILYNYGCVWVVLLRMACNFCGSQ